MSRRQTFIDDFFTDTVDIYLEEVIGNPPALIQILVYETIGSYQYKGFIPAACDTCADQYLYELFMPVLDLFDSTAEYTYKINGVDTPNNYNAEVKTVFDEQGIPLGIRVFFRGADIQPA